jgi:hypothetical protein
MSICPQGKVPIPLVGFLWNLILGIFTSICRQILILVKLGKKKNPPFSRRRAYIYGTWWVVFWIETSCDLCELRAGAGGKFDCQYIIVGHDPFLFVYEVPVTIDSKSIVKTRTELAMCVCKPCEETFKIESTFVICIYFYIVTNIETRNNSCANHWNCWGPWTLLNCWPKCWTVHCHSL